jgi:hypothetical protein
MQSCRPLPCVCIPGWLPLQVMTGSSDRRVCAWDPATGELVYELAAQQGSRVKDVAFCTASARAAIVLFDSSVAVWDLAKGKTVCRYLVCMLLAGAEGGLRGTGVRKGRWGSGSLVLASQHLV